ncbi:hypothetical protein GcM3_029017, partial [Golovinomyces cichoracearum]
MRFGSPEDNQPFLEYSSDGAEILVTFDQEGSD